MSRRIWLDPWVASVTMIRSYSTGSASQPTNTGSASGFFYKQNLEVYLITNRHVVINEIKDFFPDHLVIRVHTSETNLLPNRDINIPLYNNQIPLWREHPHINNVDVIAIKVSNLLDSSDFITLWRDELFIQEEDLIELGAPVIIMGYPMAFYDSRHNLPISRSGTLASLYGANFEGNPYFLIDANLHPGTSGSPVYMPRSPTRKTLTGYDISDRPFPPILLGINSGEYSADGVKLGLNVVWYAHLIREIIEQ